MTIPTITLKIRIPSVLFTSGVYGERDLRDDDEDRCEPTQNVPLLRRSLFPLQPFTPVLLLTRIDQNREPTPIDPTLPDIRSSSPSFDQSRSTANRACISERLRLPNRYRGLKGRLRMSESCFRRKEDRGGNRLRTFSSFVRRR